MLNTNDAALQAIAVGEARGASSLTVYATTFARMVSNGEKTPDESETVYLNRFTWLNEEKAALGKETKDLPQGKSLAAQQSKFRNYGRLGIANASRSDVLETLEIVSQMAESNYKATTKAAVAMNAALDKNPLISTEDLRNIAANAIVPEVKSVSVNAAFEKVAKAFDKIEADFPEIVAGVDARYTDAFRSDLTALLAKYGKRLNAVEAILAGE